MFGVQGTGCPAKTAGFGSCGKQILAGVGTTIKDILMFIPNLVYDGLKWVTGGWFGLAKK